MERIVNQFLDENLINNNSLILIDSLIESQLNDILELENEQKLLYNSIFETNSNNDLKDLKEKMKIYEEKVHKDIIEYRHILNEVERLEKAQTDYQKSKSIEEIL